MLPELKTKEHKQFLNFKNVQTFQEMATQKSSVCKCANVAEEIKDAVIKMTDKVIDIMEKAPVFGGDILHAVEHDMADALAKLESQTENGEAGEASLHHRRCWASNHRVFEIEIVMRDEEEPTLEIKQVKQKQEIGKTRLERAVDDEDSLHPKEGTQKEGGDSCSIL